MWNERTQVELHEKLSAAQNRSRFGLGFVPNGDRSRATADRSPHRGGAIPSNRDESSGRSSNSSSKHTFDSSAKPRHVAVDYGSPFLSSHSKRQIHNDRSRSHHSGATDDVDRHRRSSESSSRKCSMRKGTIPMEDSRTNHRKRRSHSRTSEASNHYRCRDTLQVSGCNDLLRERCMEEKSPRSSLQDAREARAREKTSGTRQHTSSCQLFATNRNDRRDVSLHPHSDRRSSSRGPEYSQKQSCHWHAKRERSPHVRERWLHDSSRSRMRGNDSEKASRSRRGRHRSRERSPSDNSVRRREDEREAKMSSRREEGTAERYRHTSQERRENSSSHKERPEKEVISNNKSSVAPSREESRSASDTHRTQGRDSWTRSRETLESRCSRQRGTTQGLDISPYKAVPSRCDDKESKRRVGQESTTAAVDEYEEDGKSHGGSVRGRTAELPSLCHGSAQEALKQRIRERLREVEQRQEKRHAGESRRVSGAGSKPALTAREGRLLGWKQLITAESQEAFETDTSRHSWRSDLERQEKERLDENVQKMMEDDDETRFTLFLEKKRQEMWQEASSRKATPSPEDRGDPRDADSNRKEGAATGVSSSGNHHKEDSHLNAIFGRQTQNLVIGAQGQASEMWAAPPKTTLPAAEIVTTTLPGLKGMALLADAVVMRDGNAGAGWKLRRQMQKQQKVGQ